MDDRESRGRARWTQERTQAPLKKKGQRVGAPAPRYNWALAQGNWAPSQGQSSSQATNGGITRAAQEGPKVGYIPAGPVKP